MGSRRSTCLPIAIRVPAPKTGAATPRLRVIEGSVLFGKVRLGHIRLGVLVGLDDGRERRDDLALAQAHHDHALGGTAEALDLLDGYLDDGAAGRDQHHLVAVADDAGARERSLRLGQLDGLHAHAAATLARIVADT